MLGGREAALAAAPKSRAKGRNKWKDPDWMEEEEGEGTASRTAAEETDRLSRGI